MFVFASDHAHRRHVYYLSWPLAFCIGAAVWMALNTVWPPPGLGEVDPDGVEIAQAYYSTENIMDSSDEKVSRESAEKTRGREYC